MTRKRTQIATGIYRDRSGVAIIVSVRGTPREFRKNEHGKAYADFSKPELLIERKRIDAREHLKEDRAIIKGDTFAADVQQFLKTLSGGHRVNTAGYMAHWEAYFADRQRNTITDLEAQTAFAAIDKGASTKRHIRRALVKFYETMNGVSGYNPARVLTPPPKPQEEARAIPFPLIERIFAALQPSRARARLKILAYVGLPQKQIKQLQPSHLRLKEKQFIAHPRRKGAGAVGRALPLSPKAVEAFKEFVELDAFGSFNNQQLVDTFRLGVKRAGVSVPDDAVPYDLRHSFLTEIYRGSGDPYALQELGIHATLDQGTRYVKGALSERATKAVSAVPRFLTTTKRGKAPKASTSIQRSGTTLPASRAKKSGKKK